MTLAYVAMTSCRRCGGKASLRLCPHNCTFPPSGFCSESGLFRSSPAPCFTMREEVQCHIIYGKVQFLIVLEGNQRFVPMGFMLVQVTSGPVSDWRIWSLFGVLGWDRSLKEQWETRKCQVEGEFSRGHDMTLSRLKAEQRSVISDQFCDHVAKSPEAGERCGWACWPCQDLPVWDTGWEETDRPPLSVEVDSPGVLIELETWVPALPARCWLWCCGIAALWSSWAVTAGLCGAGHTFL